MNLHRAHMSSLTRIVLPRYKTVAVCQILNKNLVIVVLVPSGGCLAGGTLTNAGEDIGNTLRGEARLVSCRPGRRIDPNRWTRGGRRTSCHIPHATIRDVGLVIHRFRIAFVVGGHVDARVVAFCVCVTAWLGIATPTFLPIRACPVAAPLDPAICTTTLTPMPTRLWHFLIMTPPRLRSEDCLLD